MWKYFLATTASLKHLEIRIYIRISGLLSQMLAMSSMTAPNLQQLVIIAHNGVSISRPVYDSIIFFSQIRKLTLIPWEFPEDGDLTQMQCLAGLQSLEVSPPIADVCNHTCTCMLALSCVWMCGPYICALRRIF
jgi:hypothetical protein